MSWKIVIIALLILLSSNLYAKNVNGKEVPFHGMYSGEMFPFNTDVDAIADRCVPPVGQIAWAIASFEGWGYATHLGKSYFYGEHCSYQPIGAPPKGEYGEGEFYMVAANGDILTGTYTGGMTLPDHPMYYFMDLFSFDDGGDGRFNFASGGGVDNGSVNFDDFSFTIKMEGVISYRKKECAKCK